MAIQITGPFSEVEMGAQITGLSIAVDLAAVGGVVTVDLTAIGGILTGASGWSGPGREIRYTYVPTGTGAVGLPSVTITKAPAPTIVVMNVQDSTGAAAQFVVPILA